MKGSSYRLNTPTLGILSTDGGEHRIPVIIPMNATVLAGETLDGTEFIRVIWEGKTLLMFTQDLKARGELVNVASE